nr:cyclic nucleotide-binding domain-containing protein [Anaerolineae bacterium]
WMEGKRARLAVTWAGPYTDLHQAGLASLVLFFLPDFTLNPVLFQFATVAYIGVLLNLNPLLELDGYFLLMDSLEIPMLRRKSLDFIRSGFWAKVGDLRAEGKKIREWLRAFSREERIFTVFGLLAAIWSVFSIFQALYFWQRRAAAAATSLFLQSSQAGRIAILVIGVILGLGLVVILGFTLLSLIRRLLAAAEKAGLFATPWRKAAWMWVLVLITGGAATINPSLAPSIGLLALVLATGFAVSNALDYSGSHFARVFWLMSVTCLAFWLAGLSGLAAGRVSQGSDILEMASAWVAGIAYLLLVSAALALFFGTSVRLLSLLEKIGLGLGLAASLGLMVSLAIQSQGAGNSPDAVILSALGGLPLAALLLLFPTLLAFWRTSTGPAALTIGLGLAGLSATALFDNPPVWAYLFLAAGFSLQQAAYRRRVTLHLDRDESDEVRSDHELLRQAFRWTAGGLNEQLYESAGTRQTDNLEMQFNKYAQAAGWPVQIDRDQVIDTSPSEWSLRQLGDTYTAALTLLLDLIAGHMGEKMTARALQRVYDAMPWEAREIASLYLFPELKRAQAIGQQFQAAQQTYRLLLQRAPIFAALSGEEIDHLASRLQVDKFSAGHTIIREGERGDRFYIITSGSVEVSRRNSRGISEIINHLGRGDYFGQIALLNDSPRTATCRATVPTEALSLSRAEFNKLVRVCFDLQGKIEKSIARMNLLRQIPLFSEMDSQQLQLISTHLSEERAEAGITIIRQGDDGQTFYVIESGRVQVSVSTESGEHVVNELGAGQFVGEMALLLQMPRAATVRALEPTNLLVLHKTDFDRLVVPQLYASRFLEQEMSRRMVGLRRASQAEI